MIAKVSEKIDDKKDGEKRWRGDKMEGTRGREREIKKIKR